MRIRKLIVWRWVSALLAATLVGCGKADPPPFRLNMTYVVAKRIPGEHQQEIANILGAMFGTPDEPSAPPEMGLNAVKLSMAAGPVWSDETGGKHGLYRRHCAHCHGISGDGHGPTAGILNPYPRDYRAGTFKFKSTYPAAEPTEEDLKKIVHDGIPGTAMPSFALLPPDERDALVEYVKYLSMRGQLEKALEDFVADNVTEPNQKFDPAADPQVRSQVVELLKPIVEAWHGASEQLVVPDPTPDTRPPTQVAESVEKGRVLFYGSKANCAGCHGPTALGDGQQDNFDNWNKANDDFIRATQNLIAKVKKSKEDLSKLTGEEATQAKEQIKLDQEEITERQAVLSTILPPRKAIPRDLREGVYRGGPRPIDLFWRISGGIPGTPMSQGGPAAAGAQGTLAQDQIWQIVDYIRTLPYEAASQPAKKGPVNAEPVSTGE
jgi:mono/diheme cytochrome c family protein